MGMNAAQLGMTMELTINDDETCSTYDGYEYSYDVWSAKGDTIVVDGSELTINKDGKLVMAEKGMDMVFVKIERSADESASAEEQSAEPAETESAGTEAGSPYLDRMFTMAKVETISDGKTVQRDASKYGEYTLCLYADGSVYFVQSGKELPAEYLTWSNDDAGNYVVDYVMSGVTYMTFVFSPVEDALLMDFYGILMTFVPAE